jgi:hypothetical protein
MLLGCTEFTKVYLQIKDNPWPYVNLAKRAQNSGIGDDNVIELLEIAKGHPPRVRLECDRLVAELNSLKAEISNSVRIYQDSCDRNISLKKREDELLYASNELEEAELQKTRLNGSLSQSEFQDNDTDNTNVILKARLEEIISTNDVSIQRSNIANNHQNENDEVHLYSPQVEPSSRKSIFDTKDWF